MNILNKYNITFTKATKYPLGAYFDSPTEQTTRALGMFFNGINNIDFLQYVIDNSQSVLSGQVSYVHTGIEEVDVIVWKDVTEFVPFIGEATDFDNPEYVMPTKDFRDILVEWKQFIDETKRDGSSKINIRKFDAKEISYIISIIFLLLIFLWHLFPLIDPKILNSVKEYFDIAPYKLLTLSWLISVLFFFLSDWKKRFWIIPIIHAILFIYLLFINLLALSLEGFSGFSF